MVARSLSEWFVDNKCTLQTDIKAHARRFLLTCPSHTHMGTFDIQGIQEQKKSVFDRNNKCAKPSTISG